ncbi:MAG: ABC transporter permease [Adhaeribacter sp.]
MLKNYLKIAWKVLLRRKFFTFISLFGISFTLMILMVASSLIDHATGPVRPETRLDRTLFVNFIRLTGKDGQMSTFPSRYFMNHYVASMKTPEKIAFSKMFKGVNSYVNNKRVALDLRYADATFWEVLEFEFLEGQPYNQKENREAARVAVITEHARRQYFGDQVSAVGKTLVADGVRYLVKGVVKDVAISRLNSYADIWVPLTLAPASAGDTGLHGDYMAILQAASPAGLDDMKAEYQRIVSRVKLPDPKHFDTFSSHADGILEGMVRQLMGNGEHSNLGKFFGMVFLVTLLFMLMPTINLVNINVSRILERSSEIGVRKAFGASSRTLIGQFLVENIFLTLLGGALGLVLSVGMMQLINDSNVIAHANLQLNWRLFAIGIALSLLFGLISGVYPAYKMSKLQAVEALKKGKI